MIKLFDRYVLKEIFPPFFIGLLVYTFVLLMNQILLLSQMFIDRGVELRTVLSLLVHLAGPAHEDSMSPPLARHIRTTVLRT